jgi:threonine dehydratase
VEEDAMIELQDVQAARDAIRPFIHRTPTVGSHTLSERLRTNVYLKCELFQKTGSFKPRGAFNRMLRLTEDERRHGVVAFSGGNFAQGVAYAGHTLGIQTHIIMPAHTPQNYIAATRGYGAEIELVPTSQAMVDRWEDYRSQGRVTLHPFDDPFMMAGNGTIGLELVEEIPNLTDVLVSIGGGGLMTGVAIAVKALKPAVRVWGVETEGSDAMAQSLRAGEIVHIVPTSIARTLGAPHVARDALVVARRHLEGVTVVSDREAAQALNLLLERAKVLTELAASCTLAAATRLREHFGADHHVALVLCGGNIAVDDLCRMEHGDGDG